MKKDNLLNLALVMASTLIALLLPEFIYRTFLVISYEKKSGALLENLYVFNTNMTVYDERYGYSYNPNTDVNLLIINKGKALACAPFAKINAFGTWENNFTDFKEAQNNPNNKMGPRILVFGDSFTSVSRNGETWVSLFSKRYKEKINPNVQVLNFGRDGYGIIQMIELAAGQIATWKPDVIVFAFITDDLNRLRFWRKNVETDEGAFSYVAYDPSDDVTSVDSKIIRFYDKRITKQWCEKVMRNEGRDPSISSMEEFYKKVSKTELNKSAPNFFAQKSYLFDLITSVNPIIRHSKKPITNLNQLNDASFKSAINELNNSKIPYYFFHIPIVHEMEENARWLPTAVNEKFIATLSQMSGQRPVLFLADYMKLSSEQLALFPITPQDGHPSKDGIRYISDAMIDLYLSKDRNEPGSTGKGSKAATYNVQKISSPYFDTQEGWGPGYVLAKAQVHGGSGVVVGPGDKNLFAQNFQTKSGEQYKIVARASVPKTIWNAFGLIKQKATGRFQINWASISGKFSDAYVEQFEVTTKEKTFETIVTAPSGSDLGILYVVSNGPNDLIHYTEMSLLGMSP